MTILPEDLIKLLLAVLVGGLVGAEREFRDKAAGFRTIILICVGATLFTMFSLKLSGDRGDPVRIAASIVSGVGFLGAGAIMRAGGRILGITTAATIWLAAALGMGIGGGHYVLSCAAAGIILIVLWIFPALERLIDNARHVRTYEVICPISREKYSELEAMLHQCGLRVKSRKQTKRGDEMICTWEALGASKNHDRLMRMLFDDAEVKEFRF